MFDNAIKHFPSAHTRHEGDTDIVEGAVLQSALVKLKLNKTSDFTSEAKTSLECLLKRSNVLEQNNNAEDDDLVANAMREYHDDLINDSDHLDIKFLTRSSHHCERLFSVAKRALTNLQKSMDTVSFEWQMFLYANSDMWGISDGNSVVA